MYVGYLEVELCHLDVYQVSRLGQSLITSISGPEGHTDLEHKHRHLIINQHTKCYQNRRLSCKCLIDLTCDIQFIYVNKYNLENS